ncbi:MAG: hypothetical protein IKU84_05005 [Clostridia bacterium]|nr:hypothetical protein [Clostridia bacterium]
MISQLPAILEAGMMVAFGFSWPMNVIKSYKVRTTKGKSLAFLILILVGYIVGITAKFINPEYMANIGKLWYVVTIYIINFIMVFTDLMLYIRNYKLDKKNNS